MPLFKNYSSVLFLALFAFYFSMSGMQHPHLQEQLNADTLQNDNTSFRSRFNLSLPIKSEILQTQIEEFNKRMKKSEITAKFTQTDDTFCVTFYAKIDANNSIKLHETIFPKNDSSSITERVCKTQLKRRFEGQIEDHVEKLSKTAMREAQKKFKKSWKTFFYFKMGTRIAHSVSDAIGDDLAHDIIEQLPFSFTQGNDYSQKIQELLELKKQSLAAEQRYKETKKLTDAMATLDAIANNVTPEQKETIDELKKRAQKEFCILFEQLLNQQES